MSKIRLTDEIAEKGEYTLLPEGIHAFTVIKVDDVSMSANQQEYIPVTLDIDGAELKDKLCLSQKSQWRLARFLKSLKGGESLGDLDFDPEKCKWIVGKTGQLLIEHESPTEGKYTGKKFARVKNYEWGHKLTDAPASEPEEDDVPF
jgi:hypothetical protein